MRVCIICEGCYPYVVGGVSGWVHTLIRTFKDTEFVLLAICADRSMRGHFAYELPENLTEVYEVYLNDADWGGMKSKGLFRMSSKEYNAVRSLVMNRDIDWDTLFSLFGTGVASVNDILMGPDFLHITEEYYSGRYAQLNFSDFLWTLRSIYLPMFLIMKAEIPPADLYHCVATGYAGLLGAMGSFRFGGRLLISEHGIYTREREEELIRAKWVQGVYKNIWIEQFRKMSQLSYDRADLVTSLFEHARELQIELGCPARKTLVTPNGIDPDRFVNLPGRKECDAGYINIGAVLRITPIKDVKTLIRAFSFALKRMSGIRLWVMGPAGEDPAYAQECLSLTESLSIEKCILPHENKEEESDKIPDNVKLVFTGRVDVTKYLGRMDFTVLTSISEGQPLTILESYAARLPVVATDVGNCRGLIFGEGDEYGDAGILTHIMNAEEIAAAIFELSSDQEERRRMGMAGYRRLMSRYKLSDMKKQYEEIYKKWQE